MLSHGDEIKAKFICLRKETDTCLSSLPGKYYHHAHFTEEESKTQRYHDMTKITDPLGKKAGTSNQVLSLND